MMCSYVIALNSVVGGWQVSLHAIEVLLALVRS